MSRHDPERMEVVTKTVNISAPGSTELDAIEDVACGWFTADNPPPVVLKTAKEHGHKVFRFKLTIECLGTIEP